MSHLYTPVSATDLPSPTLTQSTISPITGQPIISRPLLQSNEELEVLLQNSHAAFLGWRSVPLQQRMEIVQKAVAHLVALAPELAVEITEQMGR